METNSACIVAGLDEVGRGCLAGAVVAAAVILPPDFRKIPGLRDSKKLSGLQRKKVAEQIHEVALACALGRAEPSEIDQINILRASLLAMQRAFQSLPLKPNQALVDGCDLPELPVPGKAIIGGDDRIPAISAASVLAKVARDLEMAWADDIYPGYEFSSHKGYPTRVHLERLRLLGPCPLHRRSFSPLKDLAEQGT